MQVVASDIHRHHDNVELTGGRLVSSSESPIRADIIAEAVHAAGHDVVEPSALDQSLLTRVHTLEYVEFLSTAFERWRQRPNAAAAAMPFAWPSRGIDPRRPSDLVGQLGYHSFAADCSIVAGTWPAAHEAAAIAASAADHVAHGSRSAYGLCRPPGHHATADQFGGYCYLNNAAIAAQRLRDKGHERVAILDVDYHHGNGTQSIFFDRADVLTVSIHADPVFEFPWFVGHGDERGVDDGHSCNLNLPLGAGTTFDVWLVALETALQRITDSNASALVVSLGVDTYVHDPLGTFDLTTPDYTTMARRIDQLALPTVIIQEGGYAVADIGRNVAAFLAGLS